MNTKGFNFIDKLIAYDRLSKIKRLIDPGDTILDFGCGYQGYLLKYLSDKIKKGVGVDYDVENMKFNNLEFKKVKFVDKLPFKKGEFNKITMLAVLEHLELSKVDKLFEEFGRVLQQKGEIILTTPTKFGKIVLEFLAKLKIISFDEVMDHKKYYDFNDLESLAKKHNLNMIDYRLFQFGINSVAVFKKV